jgi:hypothetical protein
VPGSIAGINNSTLEIMMIPYNSELYESSEMIDNWYSPKMTEEYLDI